MCMLKCVAVCVRECVREYRSACARSIQPLTREYKMYCSELKFLSATQVSCFYMHVDRSAYIFN